MPRLERVVLWGLCDGASASILYARSDARVTGLVLVNPWASTEASEALTYLRHYYLGRAVDWKFWRKLIAGRLGLTASLKDFTAKLGRAIRADHAVASPDGARGDRARDASLPDRLGLAVRQFRGRILLMLSGKDLTAREFAAIAARSREWREVLHSVRTTRVELPDANHTFSSRKWRDRVVLETHAWLTAR
jgi:exosortase A-associated hydrolase 1